jgi:YD repeat-containing protein
MASWTFPQGMTVNFVYGQPVVDKSPVLTEVNNSLGRKLRFYYTNGKLTSVDNGLTGGDLRTISFAEVYNPTFNAYVFEHTDPLGAKTKIRPGFTNDKNLLLEVYDADDGAAAPSLRYTYDSLQRVKEVRDAGGLQGYDARGPYQFFIANGVRAERRDPAGGRYTAFYDLNRRPMAVQDELGRQISMKHDGRGRVIEYRYPENDKEQFEYDARNNTTKITKVPKPWCRRAGIRLGTSRTTSSMRADFARTSRTTRAAMENRCCRM